MATDQLLRLSKLAMTDKTNTTFNEYYTTYNMAEQVLRPCIDYFKDAKTICCPCDGENSQIVKWLKDNTNAKIVHFDYLNVNGKDARGIMKLM